MQQNPQRQQLHAKPASINTHSTLLVRNLNMQTMSTNDAKLPQLTVSITAISAYALFHVQQICRVKEQFMLSKTCC